jgi:phosphoenolpyruvate carboxykinase (ATP)
MFANKTKKADCKFWFMNTGQIGGEFGNGGERIKIEYTKKIFDAIAHN